MDSKNVSSDDKSLFAINFIAGDKTFHKMGIAVMSVFMAPVFENDILIQFVLFSKTMLLPTEETHISKGLNQLHLKEIPYDQEEFNKEFDEWSESVEPTVELINYDRSGNALYKNVYKGIEGISFFECHSTGVYPTYEMNVMFEISFREHEFTESEKKPSE